MEDRMAGAKKMHASRAENFNIKASSPKSAGVGYLSPAASNATEEGRALNRCVALMQDK
jgi:outer membrane protein OmpA-like peptidoglycan-associated protein